MPTPSPVMLAPSSVMPVPSLPNPCHARPFLCHSRRQLAGIHFVDPHQPGRVDVGYGLALAEGRVLTPYGGLALGGPGSSCYRLGSRLALSASLAVNVEAERADQPGQATAHSVSIRLGWQW